MAIGIRLGLQIGGQGQLAPAPAAFSTALSSVEVTTTDEGQNGFQVVFNAGRTADAQRDYALLSSPLLKPFNLLTITVTFATSSQVLINGVITHQQLNVSAEPGKSTLTVTGEDTSVMMDLAERAKPWSNEGDDAIVEEILGHYYSTWNVSPPPSSTDTPTRNQLHTDLNFVRELAGYYDYVFYVEPTDTPGQDSPYWGPHASLNGGSEQQSPLSVGMGSASNVTSINFQYDAMKPLLISGQTSKSSSVSIPNSTLTPLSLYPALMTNQPNVRTQFFNADSRAKIPAQIRAQAEVNKSSNAVTATGELDALAYGGPLRARNVVGVRGCGFSYDGSYYVKSVTHHIKLGAYTQSFTLTREGLGSRSPTVTLWP